MLIGVNILSSLRLGQRYAAHELLLCGREHGRVFGRLLELYVLNVVFFRSCPHRSTVPRTHDFFSQCYVPQNQ